MTDHVKTTIDTYNKIDFDFSLTSTPELRAWVENSINIFQKLLPGTTVLVPGCGDGRDSRFLNTLGLSVTSFDLSKGMLSQAKKHDSTGVYYEADIRDINKFKGPFAGIFASGCLYHLTKTEFIDFLSSIKEILSDQGILYINMKIGTGNEIKKTPSKDYPGGVEARASLTGPRYYQYYTHEELLRYFSAYSVIKWRNMEAQREGVHEYWLQNYKV